MTPQEAFFYQQSYTTPQPSLPSLQPYQIVASSIPSHGMRSSLQMSPRHGSKVPRYPGSSKGSSGLIGKRYNPHPFQASPSMMTRKPEPISWIKYPVDPHRIHPGPYAAVDVPFEDLNNNLPEPPRKSKLSSTWSPQKLKRGARSGKCVRFAATWGPLRGEYATINPRKLSSRYVRPAIFRRSNLKE